MATQPHRCNGQACTLSTCPATRHGRFTLPEFVQHWTEVRRHFLSLGIDRPYWTEPGADPLRPREERVAS